MNIQDVVSRSYTLPTLQVGENPAVFAIDVSGSMCDLLFHTTKLRELQDLVDSITSKYSDITVVLFNTNITFTGLLTRSLLDLKLEQTLLSGGTNVQPVVELCKENNVSNLYIVTDGYFQLPTLDNVNVTCYIVQGGCEVEGVTNIMTNIEVL